MKNWRRKKTAGTGNIWSRHNISKQIYLWNGVVYYSIEANIYSKIAARFKMPYAWRKCMQWHRDSGSTNVSFARWKTLLWATNDENKLKSHKFFGKNVRVRYALIAFENIFYSLKNMISSDHVPFDSHILIFFLSCYLKNWFAPSHKFVVVINICIEYTKKKKNM